MSRPLSRNLLVLFAGLGLITTSGCSLFSYEPTDPLASISPQHLPQVRTSVSVEAPPADPLAAASQPDLVDHSATAPAEPAPDATEIAQLTAAHKSIPTPKSADADKAAEVGSCFVEIRANGKPPRKIRMSLDDATFVQKVLEQTGLVKEFRNMKIDLTRKLPNGTRHKLEVRYNAKQKHVISAFDYALHPNDLLVIQQDSSSSLDEMLKKLAGPLGR